MAEYRWLYARLVALALVASGGIVAVGWLGDRLNVGPGTVPIWNPDGRGFWLAGLGLVFAVALIYQWLDRPIRTASGQYARTPAQGRSAGTAVTRWIFPAMVVLSIVLFLGVYRGTTALAFGALLTFLGLLAGTISRHWMMVGAEEVRERIRLMYTLLVHGVAFLSLSMIYINKVRSLFSATAVLLITVLLLLALTESEAEFLNRRLVYAIVGGIMLGEVTWALNYWQATGWTGGAVLLVFFYLFGGLILTHLRRGVYFRDLAEYGSVAIVAFAIVVYSLVI